MIDMKHGLVGIIRRKDGGLIRGLALRI